MSLRAALDVVLGEIERQRLDLEVRSKRARAAVLGDIARGRARRSAEGTIARAEHESAIAALPGLATKTDGRSHQETCDHIDTSVLRAKYRGGPVFPLEWDALRPRAKSDNWTQVDADVAAGHRCAVCLMGPCECAAARAPVTQ